MRVVAHRAERLVIEDRPWVNAGLVWLVGALALGSALAGTPEDVAERLLVGALGAGALVAAWGLFPFQILVFDRDAAQFTRSVRRLFATTTTAIALDRVVGAEVDRQWLEAGWMERLQLMTVNGAVALETGFSGGSRASVAAAINTWLERARA